MNGRRTESGTAEDMNPSSSEEGLLKASSVAGSMTMFSRILGLARDIVIARVFGVTDAADAFFLANKIPNFLRRLFAEGAFNQAFVPVLSEYRSQKSHKEVLTLINSVAASLTNKEHAEVVDRFMKDILERDFNGGNWH